MAGTLKQCDIVDALKKVFGEDIIDSSENYGELTVAVRKEVFYRLAKHIHDRPELKFDYMANMTAVDYLDVERPYGTRFVAVYHFFSMDHGFRLRVKLPVSDAQKGVSSVTSIWKSAGFFEREAYDMFGIIFDGNPDLRRIYMPDDWEGYPLRKDYPLEGDGESI